MYLSSIIFEGIVRFSLYNYGMTYLLYIRDLFIIIIIAVYILHSLLSSRINRIFLIIIVLLIFHSIIALFYVSNVLMPLFAWKTLILLFFGILFGHLFFTNLRMTIRIFSILLICAIIGILINYFIAFPWEGLEYSIGGVDIEGVRAWADIFSIKRLSGFSRTSYDAAIQMLLLGLFLFCHLKNKFFRNLLWILIALPLLLTTTKGIIVTYSILTMFLLIYRIVPNYGKIYNKGLYFLLIIAITFPIMSIITYSYTNVPLVLLSFFMRVGWMWPGAFELIHRFGSLILGRGFGGIGSSQIYFEPEKLIAPDNIFIAFYGNFGLLGVGYLFYLARLGQTLNLKTEKFYFLILFSFFTYGIVAAGTQNDLFCLFLGIFLGYINNQKLRNAKMCSTIRLNDKKSGKHCLPVMI